MDPEGVLYAVARYLHHRELRRLASASIATRLTIDQAMKDVRAYTINLGGGREQITFMSWVPVHRVLE